MKIILTGGGSGEKTKEIDQLFSSLINKEKPLLYIPIAIDTKKHPYPECLKWLKGTFEPLEIKKYVMWTEKEIKNASNPEKFGGIYIGGGNTFYLLKNIKETPLYKFIEQAISLDIPIYGGSAGAIIFGKTIETSTDQNNVLLKDLKGFDKLKGMNISCHYKEENDKAIKEIMKNKNIGKVIALTERAAIFLKEEKLEFLGKGSYLFSS